jgi:glutamate racemase
LTSSQPIGIFDSGIGGVSVLRAVHALLPHEDVVYFGDTAHLPYGEKTMDAILRYSDAVTRFLIARGCKLIVIACNTASAAALVELRKRHPEVSFIGMEPAVKPAAEQTQTGTVGVIATTATFQGELFASVVERFAKGVNVIHQPCPGLVQQIEAGRLDTPDTEVMLRSWLEPMVKQNIDALVLGCTHYPFVAPAIRKIVGGNVRIIDPAPAVARQVQRVLEQKELLSMKPHEGEVVYYTSGDVGKFRQTLITLTDEDGDVFHAEWDEARGEFGD